MRVAVEAEPEAGDVFELVAIRVDAHAQDVLALAAVDRQDAVRRDDAARLLELRVVAVLGPLALGDRLDARGDELGGVPQERPRRPAHLRLLTHQLGEDIFDAGGHVVHVVELLPRIDHAGQELRQRLDGGVAAPDRQGQRFEALLLGLRRQRLLLGLERQVQVVEPLRLLGVHHRFDEVVGQLALVGDAAQDRLLLGGDFAQELDAALHPANLRLVEAAGALLAVAGDERHGVLVVEQLHHRLDLGLAELQVLGNA